MPELAIELGRLTRAMVWLGLAHGLWMGLAVSAVSSLALRAWPGLPRLARHRIVLGAFLLATIGPFVVGASHREAARRSARGPVGVVTITVAPATEAAERAVDRREAGPRGLDRPDVRRRVAGWASAARPWVLACWASGLAGMVGMVGLGVCASRRLLRQCRPAPGAVEGEACRLGRGLGLRRCPPVLVHDSLGEPCLCGIVRPSIVLPAGWLETARPGVVSAVLAHELAHARRRDPLTNLIHRFLEALVLFHPGARRLSRALRLQREHRADALAVRLTGDPRGLAEALEGFARIRLAPRFSGPLGASLGGESSTLLPRIQEILDMTSKSERIGFWTFVNLPVAGLLALAITTSGLARDEPAAKADDAPRFEAKAAAAIAGEPWEEEPMISYEVRLLEVDDLLGIDFDFEAGDDEDPVLIAFLSELEQLLLIGCVSRSPSGWMIQAPWVTAFEGNEANFRFPREPGLDLDGVAPSTSVAVSGTIDAEKIRDYVQLSIRLTEEDPGAGRRDREDAEGRQVRVTVPNGGTVILSTDDPAAVDPLGRRRVILLTPRRIVTEEEEVPLIRFNPGVTR
ncbi:hypothetical protein BH23PLA1_BH23PLA1_42860 [soil metagenome]